MTNDIDMINIADLRPYEKNARRHEAADVQAIAKSIEAFGFNDPVGVWGPQNIIVEGHGRVMAAKQLGMIEVPCIRLDDLTDEQRRAYALAHNKTAELSAWDAELLPLELQELPSYDMTEYGFTDIPAAGSSDQAQDIVEDDIPDDDDIEARVQTGDVWRLGEHRLICGDSTDAAVIDRLMDGAKADLVLTDPPYGVSYSDKNDFLNKLDGGKRNTKAIANDALASAEQEKDLLWIPALKNARDNATDRCSYYVASPQGGELMMMMMMMAIKAAGWQLKHTIIWNKNNHVLGRSDYNYKHEPLLYGWNKQHDFYGAGKQKTSVWDIAKPQKSDLHPTMKPIELMAECVLNSTKKADNVLDVFGGSGSTLIACEQTGRRCFICELDPHYCDIIIKRWEDLTGQTAVLERA